MSDPTPTTLTAVRDQICRWFGGPYEPNTRSYRTPQVKGLGVVRRARPKREDNAEFFLGAPSSGALMGAQMLVHIDGGVEQRAAMAGPNGLKQITLAAVLHVFLRSYAEFGEDAVDAFYDFLERLEARLREDPCLGSGGFETGGFDVGEGGSPWIRWQMALPETSAEMTQAYASVEFEVRYYQIG